MPNIAMVRSPLRIVECRDHAGRLVEGEVKRRSRGLDAFPVNLDAVFVEIRLGTKFPHHCSVDGYAPFQYPLLRLPARSEACARHDFLQSFQCAIGSALFGALHGDFFSGRLRQRDFLHLLQCREMGQVFEVEKLQEPLGRAV